MNLAEKIKHLRKVEGELRGFNRPMTQTEVVKAMQEELHETLSQAYLSQLESGKRVHLTASSRILLASFFKVHPGYLVSDPPDYSTDLLTEVSREEDRLGAWLAASAEEWRSEPVVAQFLEELAVLDDARKYMVLLQSLLTLPVEQLEEIVQVIRPELDNGSSSKQELRSNGALLTSLE